MGDPTRARLAAQIIKVIRDEGLLASTAQVGDKLYSSIKALSTGPAQGKIHGLRGKGAGTMIAFDCESSEKRDRFLVQMRQHGVNMGATLSGLEVEG
jgi:4-aminobutyrate aminotransferase/(S)-3-amino-2-methylpropionate transaminase